MHSPATIFLTARSSTKAKSAIDSVKAQCPSSKTDIRYLELDTASLESVKSCAKRFSQESSRLDILVLNAGIASNPHALTSDGYELHFGTNHMGHALLTQLLMPTLLRTAASTNAKPRVVVVSSAGAKYFAPKTGILYDQLKTDMKDTSGMALYGQSKLANVVFAKSLAKRYPQLVTASLHPGTVITPIYHGEKSYYGFWASLFYKYVIMSVVRLTGVTPEEGAKGQLWCAVSNDVKSGAYYDPVGKPGDEAQLAKDESFADKLWTWTDEELKNHGAPGWPS